jgi:hypothetical protein
MPERRADVVVRVQSRRNMPAVTAAFRPEGGFFAFGEAATVLREIEAAASPTNALDPRD